MDNRAGTHFWGWAGPNTKGKYTALVATVGGHKMSIITYNNAYTPDLIAKGVYEAKAKPMDGGLDYDIITEEGNLVRVHVTDAIHPIITVTEVEA